MKIRLSLCLLPLLAALALPEAAGEENAPAPLAEKESESKEQPASAVIDWTGKVVVIPIKGIIASKSYGGMEEEFNKAMKRVAEEPPKLVVLEVESPGGMVESCENMVRKLLKCKVPTVALVHKAISGGAMLATACNQIVMLKNARIGDIQPMMMMPGGKGMDDRTAEKIEADVRAIMAVNAERNGYPIRLLESMVSRSIELYWVAFDDGKREFMTKKQFDLLEENIKLGREKRKISGAPEIIVEEGKLLVLTPGQTVKYGLAKSVVRDREEFFQARAIDKADIITAELPDGKFDLSGMFPEMKMKGWRLLLLGLFLVIGIAGVITEANTPGFGIPGAIGLIGFTCFFYMLVRAGNAEWYEVLLFVVGISLLLVEIVVIPGFGVPGIMGIICIVGGMLLAFLPPFEAPSMRGELMWGEMGKFVILLMCALSLASILLYGLFHYGGKLPFMRYLYLRTSLRSGAEVRVDTRADAENEEEMVKAAHAQYLGQKGVAVTALRPAGKVRLESGDLIDVVTQGDLIDAHARVAVVETRMNRIVVASEPAEPPDSAPRA